MLRRSSTLALLLWSILPLNATIPINTDAVAASVVFIYAANSAGEVDETKPLATGFFVAVALKSNPARAHIVLATARHVFDPQWANCGWNNPNLVYLRLNRKNYSPATNTTGVGYVKLPLRKEGRALFVVPNDDKIDAAIIRISATALQDYQFGAVPLSMFATPEETHSLGIGDQIVTAGLVPGVPGANRN